MNLATTKCLHLSAFRDSWLALGSAFRFITNLPICKDLGFTLCKQSIWKSLDLTITFERAARRLFIFITGNDRVPVTEGKKIKVSLLPTHHLPSSHSCFQQLDIGYLRYVDANGTMDELHEKIKTDLYRSLEQYNVFTGDGIL